MSLPPAGNASGGPGPNWYPDPSIPGYIRYWDGQTWVAGSSRPEPREGEPLPTPPTSGAASAPPAGAAPVPAARDEADDRAALPVRENRAEIAASRDQHVGPRPDEDVSTSPVAAPGRVDPRGQFLRTPSEGSEPPPAAQPAGRPKAEPEGPNEQTFGLRSADLPPQRSASAQPPPAGGPPGLGLPGTPQPASPPPSQAPAAPAQQPPAQQQQPASGGPESGPPGLGLPGAANAAPAADPPAAAPQPPPQQGAQPPAGPPHQGQPGQQGQPQGGVPGPGQIFPPPAGGAPGQQPPAGYGFPQPGGQPGPPGGAPGQPGGGYGFPPPAGGQPPGGYGYPPQQPGQPGGGYGYPPAQGQPQGQSAYLQSHEGAPLTMMAKFTEPEQKYPAAPGKRLFARIIDAILPLGGAAALAVPLLGDARDHINDRIDSIEHAGVNETVWLIDGTTGGYLAMVLGVFLGVGLLFEVLPVALWGTTLGKAMLGLKVLDMEQQEPPSFGKSIVRWLVYNLLAVVLVGIVNMILAVRDRPWRQGWHDKAAKTFVAGKGRPPGDPVGAQR